MQFFDLHVHSAFSAGKSSIQQLAAMAKRLGYSGICFEEYFDRWQQVDKLKGEIEAAKQATGIEILLGFEARTIKELRMLKKKRRRFDLLLAHGGKLRMNRAACESAEVDILTHPEAGRQDSGIDAVMAKLAVKNNVAIEINFRQILMVTKQSRAQVLARMRENVKLAKRYKAPIIICSGAISKWQLRDPLCMISMATQLGLTLAEAKAALSKTPREIINCAKERASSEWIMPGVKIVK